MKQILLVCFFCISVFSLIAQERVARGYVLDKDSHAAMSGVVVNVYDTAIICLTDSSGAFSIEVPKGRRQLLFSFENYETLRVSLRPDFRRRTSHFYLQSLLPNSPYSKKRLEEDSLFRTYKNGVSLSLIELAAVAIAIRYERFLTPGHSIGLHTSLYVAGHSYFGMFVTSSVGGSGSYNISSNYTGVKTAPFYRYYPFRKNKTGLFLEGKIPLGYFYFYKLEYQYSSNNYRTLSTTHAFWTWGFGISAGVMLTLPKSKHGFMNISVGYQYFPIVEGPEYLTETVGVGTEYETVLKHKTTYDWWYQVGPGSKFDLKITIGGIF